MANRLAAEASPYLRQHADNPVAWWPWDEAALAEAVRRDCPLFISIGYSTCHWCHVMAHESFEDPDVAALLNQTFVCIKVDREERPDLDHLYLTACQMLTGGGGWPLTIVATPDGRPFFAATYIPPDARFGRPGLRQLVPQLQRLWTERRPTAEAAASELARALRDSQESRPRSDGAAGRGGEARDQGEGESRGGEVHRPGPGTGPADLVATEGEALSGLRQLRQAARMALARAYDAEHGGFGEGMKFPLTGHLRLLVQLGAAGDGEAATMATHTLARMAAGGIHDRLGGGFHRYSTTPDWRLPHFEKMLYDQALLATSLVEARGLNGSRPAGMGRPGADGPRAPGLLGEGEKVLEGIVCYVLRDLTGPDGAFYAAEDADSPSPDGSGSHTEGAFYLWRLAEVAARLSPADLALAVVAFDLSEAGNHKDERTGRPEGSNVLHQRRTLAELSAMLGEPGPRLGERLSAIATGLATARAGRPRPHRDEKVLADWNGLMIEALARAGWVSARPDWVAAAGRSATALLDGLREGDRLLHCRRGERTAVVGLLDDHAFLLAGLLALCESDDLGRWLPSALWLADELVARFPDPAGGPFFLAASGQQTPLARPREPSDGALPAGNSVAIAALLRLVRLTGEGRWLEAAKRALAASLAWLRDVPLAATGLLLAAREFPAEGAAEVAVAGTPGRADTMALLAAARDHWHPGVVVTLVPTGSTGDAVRTLAPRLAALPREVSRATAWVCDRQGCHPPTAEPQELARLLAACRPTNC